MLFVENVFLKGWSRRVGLNHRPTVYETVALPLSYAGLCSRLWGMPSRLSFRNAQNCSSLLGKVQDKRMLVVGLFLGLIGLYGFSGSPIGFPVSRDEAVLISPDVLSQLGKPVLLSTRLVKTRMFMQIGLGGEPVEFLVDGTSVGRAMTGGDGWARKEFVSRKNGLLELTVKLAHGKRVKARPSTSIISNINLKQSIVLVDLQSTMVDENRQKNGLLDLSMFFSRKIGFSQPQEEAVEALVAISKRASLVYLVAGQAGGVSDIHRWINDHEFPDGPVFWLRPDTHDLMEKIQNWKEEGWTNIEVGISKNINALQEYLDHELRAIAIVSEDDEEDIPDGVAVVRTWEEITTEKFLKKK